VNSLRGSVIENILQWVDKFDITPKIKEPTPSTPNTKVLGSKGETGKKIGVKNISNDFFSDFDAPSEESEEEKKEQEDMKKTDNFSRLGYNEKTENKKIQLEKTLKKKLKKKKLIHTDIINLTMMTTKRRKYLMIAMKIEGNPIMIQKTIKMYGIMIEMKKVLIEGETKLKEIMIDMEEIMMMIMIEEIMIDMEEIMMTLDLIRMKEKDSKKKGRKIRASIQRIIQIQNQYHQHNYLVVMKTNQKLLMGLG